MTEIKELSKQAFIWKELKAFCEIGKNHLVSIKEYKDSNDDCWVVHMQAGFYYDGEGSVFELPVNLEDVVKIEKVRIDKRAWYRDYTNVFIRLKWVGKIKKEVK